MVSFYKVWPWHKVKEFDVFSVIRLNREAVFLIGTFLGVLCFPSALVIAAEGFEKRLLRSFISKYVFLVIAN